MESKTQATIMYHGRARPVDNNNLFYSCHSVPNRYIYSYVSNSDVRDVFGEQTIQKREVDYSLKIDIKRIYEPLASYTFYLCGLLRNKFGPVRIYLNKTLEGELFLKASLIRHIAVLYQHIDLFLSHPKCLQEKNIDVFRRYVDVLYPELDERIKNNNLFKEEKKELDAWLNCFCKSILEPLNKLHI